MQTTYHCSLFEMLVLSDNVLWSVWHNFHHCEANDYCLSHTKIMRNTSTSFPWMKGYKFLWLMLLLLALQVMFWMLRWRNRLLGVLPSNDNHSTVYISPFSVRDENTHILLLRWCTLWRLALFVACTGHLWCAIVGTRRYAARCSRILIEQTKIVIASWQLF